MIKVMHKHVIWKKSGDNLTYLQKNTIQTDKQINIIDLSNIRWFGPKTLLVP